jgi:hypothetical protein
VNTAVPMDGPVQLVSVQLPVGARLGEADDGGPLLWATTRPIPNPGRVWQRLTDIHASTGLAPILLGFLHLDDGRPWDSGELDGPCDLALVDRLDAAQVIAQSWADSIPSEEDMEEEPEFAAEIAPFGIQFPGLARRQDEPSSRRSCHGPSTGSARPGSAWFPRAAQPMCSLTPDTTAPERGL